MNNHISKAQIKQVRSLHQKKNRDELGIFIAEGEKCVNEIRRAFELIYLVTPSNATAIEIKQMSSLQTPQGVIGVFRKRDDTYELDNIKGLIIALDGIQDPGNLGTIIRTCDWFGVRHIFCSKDTADCYNPKVIQSTMGALSRVHLHYVDLPDILLHFKNQSIPLYGTLLNGINMYEAHAIPNKSEGIIVMGNEGKGISSEIQALITHPLRIPSYPEDAITSESLNVGIATAIVLAEFRK